MLNEIQVV